MLQPIVNAAATAPVAVTPSIHTNNKDNVWLTLEVCREFQRNKCSRTDTECKYAHPPPHVEIVNGRVTACFDSIKGKCTRKEPPCKYLHPPQHLKEVLLQNGRRNLIMKNSRILGNNQLSVYSVPTAYIQPQSYLNAPIMYDLGGKTVAYTGGMLHGQTPVLAPQYYGQLQTPQLYPIQYINSMYTGVPLPVPAATDNSAALIAQQFSTLPISPHTSVSTVTSTTPKSPQHDLLEPQVSADGVVTAAKKRPRESTIDYLNAAMVPTVKRMAFADNKSGLPVYQPTIHMPTYQQALAMQFGQPQCIPTVTAPPAYATHPASLPKY